MVLYLLLKGFDVEFSYNQYSEHFLWVVSFVVILYLVFIFVFGLYFSRFNSNINDFFYSGNRFSWWLPTMSLVATGIGAYSYLKYSEQGFNTGVNSSHVYSNDWFLFPIFLFGWLPILYFNRIKSVPEYFGKRFNPLARTISVMSILAYIFYYIGFNLFTIGVAIENILRISPWFSLPLMTFVIVLYVIFGGQTAVVFTDFFQGIILYLVGFLVVGAGLYALGGLAEFWSYLPETHQTPLAVLNENHRYNTAGIFWGDALAGSVAFLYMNQGFLMRFMTIKNMAHTQIAALVNICVTLPVSVIIVGGTGWIARAILSKQEALGSSLGEAYSTLTIENSYHTFLQTAYVVLQHNDWILGFIFAALIAALMSTLDSLITAASAIFIYDIYKPLIRSQASDQHYLKMARFSAGAVGVLGLILVIWFFTQKGTLMSIHYKGIMMIIPPMVTAVFMGVVWKNFNAFSACTGMCLGIMAIFLSIPFPEPVYFLREFLLGSTADKEIIFFRAPYGILATALFSCLTQWIFPKGIQNLDRFKKTPLIYPFLKFFNKGADKNVQGLTLDTLDVAYETYKGGSRPNFKKSSKAKDLKVQIQDSLKKDEVNLSQKVCQKIEAELGDFVYVSDQRWFLGGVRSGHFKIKSLHSESDEKVQMSSEGEKRAYLLKNRNIYVEKTI